MNVLRTLLRNTILALALAGLMAAQAIAMPRAGPAGQAGVPVPADSFMRIASDCYSVGQQVAQQHGGTLAKASQSTQGGQPVCVIVVLVPGKDGKRPRRTEVVVPQN
jgi:hypothetical protein